jgi:hypothetical protein
MIAQSVFLRINCYDKGMHEPNGLEIYDHVRDMLGISALGISHAWRVYYDRGFSLRLVAPSDNDTLNLFGLGLGLTRNLKFLRFGQGVTREGFSMPG